MNPDENWVVYLVRCSDQSLYCGITNDLEKRLKAHNIGKGAKYTRSRTPVELLATRSEMTRSDALKLEYRIKKTPAKRKRSALENAQGHSKTRKAEVLQEIEKELQGINAEIRKLCAGVAELAVALEAPARAGTAKSIKKKLGRKGHADI